MFNYKIIIEYDGSSFFGWQKQDNGPTIQESVEDSLRKLTSENVTLFGAGRTDSGVHARGQVANFIISKDIALDTIRDGLNQHLRPNPISIIKVEKVDSNFNSRFSAKSRHYEYRIINRRSPLTFYKNQAWGIFKKLDIENMKKATNYFIGKHDFDAFRSIDCQSSTSLKTIDKCELQNEDEKIFINISAKSFLHSQVRIIVGTLVEVGKGKIIPEEIKNIIISKDRSRAGPTAPAHGLYLIKVEY